MRDALLTFPDAGIPEAATRRRLLLIRTVAVAALAVTGAYLTWRLLATVDLRWWWVSVPLLLLEVHAAAGLALFTFSLWDVDRRPATAAPRRASDSRIAVLVPTYNEPVEVLLPTVAAAVALEPAHQTWVLDDGDRQEIADLAARLGARYLARTDRSHAKAGNVNHAIDHVDADLVAILDADHVATSAFLTNTIGYFDDPRVAVVQTPQDFYNRDSFEHEDGYQEQGLFYRVLQAGKNRWGAAFWCGTGAVVRMAALREVGGVATDTVTEDIHTTIRLHRRGWKTVYHNEVLARGLAAADADQYATQRLRWGTGAMQVLRSKDNPLFCGGLTAAQRACYAATLLGWFDSWRSLGYLVAPLAVVTTGAVPIRSHPGVFAAAFLTTFALQRLALVLLARGRAPQILSVVFEMIRMPANLLATLTLLSRRAQSFRVTPKGRVAGGRRRVQPPVLLSGLVGASVVATIWFALSAAGRTPTEYEVPWAAYGAFAWLVVNAALLATAITRITAERFARERRASVRFPIEVGAYLDGRPCQIRDLSVTGAQIVLAKPPRRMTRHHVQLPAMGVDLAVELRTIREVDGGRLVQIGAEFGPGQLEAVARLSLALFHGLPVAAPAADVVTQPARRARGVRAALAVPAALAGLTLLLRHHE